MWDRIEIKQQGKAAFKANYWRSVLAALILTILTTGSAVISGSNSSDTNSEDTTNEAVNGVTEAFNGMGDAAPLIIGILAAIGIAFLGIGILLKIFVFNPLQVGCYGFFRENAGGKFVEMDILKTGFKQYGHTFITLLLRDLFLFLWACLLIFPGIIKLYSYRMVPFILRDNPELSATEVITASRQLMNGHKWNTFIFDLSYIGWYLLGCVTLGLVNVFWTEPYRQNANAALYLTLIGENMEAPEARIL